MLIPLIVIGVLFLITWIVIICSAPESVDATQSDTKCCTYGPIMQHDPFCGCRSKLDMAEYENRRLWQDNKRLQKSLEACKCSLGVPMKTPEELIKEHVGKQTNTGWPPEEIKLGKYDYKLKK